MNRGGYAQFGRGLNNAAMVHRGAVANNSAAARLGGARNFGANQGTRMAQSGVNNSGRNLNNRQLPTPNSTGNSRLSANNANNGLTGLNSAANGNMGSRGYNFWGSNFLGSGYGNRGLGYGYGNSGYGYGNGGYGYGNRGYGYGNGGYGYGNGGPYVMVYLPGVGWVLVPLRAIRGMGMGMGAGMGMGGGMGAGGGMGMF